MERSARSRMGECEGDPLLWRKRLSICLALLSDLILLVMWMQGEVSGVRAAPAPSDAVVVPEDEALLSALNQANSFTILTPSYETFLLAGGSDNEGAAYTHLAPIEGWSDGKWYPMFESSSRDFRRHVGTTGGLVKEHGASFSAKFDGRRRLEWSSTSVTTPVQAVEGVLELRNFWDWIPCMEAFALAESSDSQLSPNQMLSVQNLKVYLKGASVETLTGRRLYMAGCAHRIDHSYHIDCGFRLTMTYTTLLPSTSTPTRNRAEPDWRPPVVQANLTWTSPRADDPDHLRLPTTLIDAGTVPAEYASPVTYRPPELKPESKAQNAKYDNARYLRRSNIVDGGAFALAK